MKIPVDSGQVRHSNGSIAAPFAVLEAREIDGYVLVIFDYMAFPRGKPARNLFAYSAHTGAELWRAEDIGAGGVDAYVSFISESPLVIWNFACFECHLDLETGKVIGTTFTK